MLVPVAVALTIPLLGLGLLLARPEWELVWHHNPAHFWLVLSVAAVNAVLAHATGVAAVRRADARVLLVSYTFLTAAGFLGLHALATPGVLLDASNAGFVVATPLGLVAGSLFAVASSLDLEGDRRLRTMRMAGPLRLAILAAIVVWAVVSIADLPPLRGAPMPERASGGLLLFAVPATGLYLMAAWRYVTLWRQRRSSMLLQVTAAFVLLAEATVGVTFARDWHTSWWEWHGLMLLAFGLIAWGAQAQWHEERFADLYLNDTASGERDVSVVFADLQGFTTFSERHDATTVAAMLNTYFEAAIPPIVSRFGGDVDRIVGDAVMITFNRRGDQADHAWRAASAALSLQAEAARVSAQHPDWPRFRAGVNSGPVSISVLGAEGGRTHTMVGDTVNVAARLEGVAPVGGVAVSGETRDRLHGAHVELLGRLDLKGKTEPVTAYRLLSVD
jgi:class 3 adenylate cyclase